MTARKIAIVGGGISGLSTAFFLKDKLRDRVDISIYEKDDRLGGTIGVTRENGYIADWGPNGFLDREPLTLQFINQIGLRSLLLPSNEKSEKRFIYRNGRLWEISANPVKFLFSGLLSRWGRFRIGMEYFVPAKKDDRDETIFDFATRRIGKEAAQILIDPMVSGIFGGDAERLSLGACFPVMEEMEKQYGGLIKAMLKKKKEKRKEAGAQKGGPGGPTGHLTSFRGGLYTIIEHLEKNLSQSIFRNTEVKEIIRGESSRFKLISGHESKEFDDIILAVPSYHAAGLLHELSPEIATQLHQIPYASLAVVCHGYRRQDIEGPVDGFGFLVPHSQRLDILGSIWTSVIFPEQAPEDQVLFRTMLGGARNNDMVRIGEDKLADIAHRNLSGIIGLRKPPAFLKVITWKDAIPQYTLGHRGRLAAVENRLNELRGIYLAGNAYTGVGLNDAIKRSYKIAESIAVAFNVD